MTAESACQDLISEFRSRPTLRSGSLITTVFGDAIAPRGGTVWLGSLIKVMAEFGLNERRVRTAVFRLAKDGWLRSDQIGRRSYYSLTEQGRERFEQATHRIYGTPASHWDGDWCLLLLSGLDTATREIVRKECGWLGFGPVSANVLAHPSPDLGELDITIRRLGVTDRLVVMRGQSIGSEIAMRELTRNCWSLDDIDARYEAFVARFRPLMRALAGKTQLTEKSAFIVRTLLIQEYRKVLLRDPVLPVELLPPNWHGVAAYQLCRNLYRIVHARADAYLDDTIETADGPLPPPTPAFRQRFGGLAPLASQGVRSS
ncbi:MAG: phenylacetic acid degradation operon negative regulatory protein PaaX [Gammaproteobacteria bacterium]|nr:phenylacetic acid degradation operon negative regulatory protein PaaX [Gammaproteobacteria bacterium]MBU2676767.1 phenylacetic acid degradation operon negative regulatory protein PaaX [Gammaproteobacteria bacterium]NNL50501.1 phenylacetic acid degradation operon negative regulatory protein PaaX [Woeseiaceae bacterium]